MLRTLLIRIIFILSFFFLLCNCNQEQIDKEHERINDLKEKINAIQTAINKENVKISDVKQNSSSGALIILLDNGRSYTLSNGVKGEDGKESVLLKVEKGFWSLNGKRTQYNAEPDKTGLWYKPGQDGYWHKWSNDKDEGSTQIRWMASDKILQAVYNSSEGHLTLYHLLGFNQPVNLTFPMAIPQGNDFKIGMFMFQWKEGKIPTDPKQGGYNTSHLNVLREDGFNACQAYYPDWWISEENMDNLLTLVKANDMQMLPNAILYYWPDHPNEYDCKTGARPNYDGFIDHVFSKDVHKNTIWGIQITEEASYFHMFNPGNNPPCGYSTECSPNPLAYYEVPLSNVNQAIKHFRDKLNSKGMHNQKLMIMEAAHGREIGDLDPFDTEGIYIPGDYLKTLNRPDVFFEGSYNMMHQFPYQPQDKENIPKGSFHYLGFLQSIEYAKKYIPEVHKVVGLEGEYGDGVLRLDPSIPNANWLWFQSYASIVHGVLGFWFGAINFAWAPDETPAIWDKMNDRFERERLPRYYKDYTAYLAKELRYLVDKNLLSTDPNTVVCSKTNGPDPSKILPTEKSYLPQEYRDNLYDLRYTIRTNGEEYIMIIVNPLTYAVSDVTLDFSNISNPFIKNATGVDILFANQTDVTSVDYKTNRDSEINLSEKRVGKVCHKEIKDHKLNLSFGPLDVHVIQFKSGSQLK